MYHLIKRIKTKLFLVYETHFFQKMRIIKVMRNLYYLNINQELTQD